MVKYIFLISSTTRTKNTAGILLRLVSLLLHKHSFMQGGDRRQHKPLMPLTSQPCASLSVYGQLTQIWYTIYCIYTQQVPKVQTLSYWSESGVGLSVLFIVRNISIACPDTTISECYVHVKLTSWKTCSVNIISSQHEQSCHLVQHISIFNKVFNILILKFIAWLSHAWNTLVHGKFMFFFY